MVQWCALVLTMSNHVEEPYNKSTDLVHIAQHGSTHVAFVTPGRFSTLMRREPHVCHTQECGACNLPLLIFGQ